MGPKKRQGLPLALKTGIDGLFSRNCVGRAGRGAGTAILTLRGIDPAGVVLFGNGVRRTFIFTGAAIDTLATNLVRHHYTSQNVVSAPYHRGRIVSRGRVAVSALLSLS
jgi:hypothetical protein